MTPTLLMANDYNPDDMGSMPAGFIYQRPWGPEWDPHSWYMRRAGSWRTRRQSQLGKGGDNARLFASALRAAAHIWHNTLTQADRAQWVLWSLTQDGARPGRKACPPNGWDLFAMTALAPCWFSAPTDGLTQLDDYAWPISLTFDSITQDPDHLNFTVTVPLHPYNRTGIDFVYMIDPPWVGFPGADRRTLLCGYYQNKDHPEPQAQQFYVEPTFDLDYGQGADVLVRHHASLYGVANYQLHCDLT
jgi:hypothetical protein